MTHSEVHGTPAQAHRSGVRATRTTRARAISTGDIALIATFAALIAVCAILPALTISGLVPITLQTFGVLLAGAVLGARRGFLAVTLYLAIGAIGIPVFAGGQSGLAPFAGASAGYLVAMPFAAAITGFIVTRISAHRGLATQVTFTALAGVAASVIVMYPLGILGMSWRGGMTLAEAFVLNLTFTPGDLIKAVLAALVATTVHRTFPDLLSRR